MRPAAWRAVLAVVAAVAAPLPAGGQQHATVAFVVRHAERDSVPVGDPGLTPAGERRVRALAEALAAAGITDVIVTDRRRTQLTAAPFTATAQVEVVGLAPGVADHVARVAAAVRARRGGTVLVVGHSNTVPAIVAALGGPAGPDLCDGTYDRLYTVVLRGAGSPAVSVTRFGAPAADTSCAAMPSR